MGSYETDSFAPTTQVELDFEQQNWSTAREIFKGKHKDGDMLQSFLRSQTTGYSVKEECLDLQNKSDAKYFKGLGNILDKIDTLMKLGDLAIKSAPESVGLAWCGIRMCLHAIQGDFATFQLFGGACADIIGIMISCRVYGKMYGNRKGPEDFQELHDKVVQYIPSIYVEILDFSYAVRKYTSKHVAIRIGKNLIKDTKGGFQLQITAIQDHEKEMRSFAKIATDRLMVHSQDQMLVEIGHMSEILDANLKANEIFVRHIEALEEERKDLRRKTPLEEAQEEFDKNKRELNPSPDQSEILSENLDVRREPGTCQWIFNLETYKKWHDSSDENMLWVSGAAGYGKSILMSTVIERLKTEHASEEPRFVHYFFCKTGEEATQSTQRILQTLVFQLYVSMSSDLSSLEKANSVFRAALGKEGKGQAKSGSKPFNFELLYGGLLKVLDHNFHLVIDAIDECNDRQDKRLLQALKSVADNAKDKFKVMLCSRPEPDISNALHTLPNISCESHNEGDIRKNIASEMDRFPGWTLSEKANAVDVIVRKAGGQFRYVQVALQVLRKPLMRPYQRALENLPDGLIGSYASSWKMTNPDYIDLLKTSLTWTILAARPITVPEIMDAYSRTYSSEFGVSEMQEDALEDSESANLHDSQVRIAGGNFLEVSGIREIGLRHATVKDFFLKEAELDESPTEPISTAPQSVGPDVHQPKKIVSEWLVCPKQGHFEIARTLIQNLVSPAFQQKYMALNLGEVTTSENDIAGERAMDVKDITNEANVNGDVSASNDIVYEKGTSHEDSTNVRETTSEIAVNAKEASDRDVFSGEAATDVDAVTEKQSQPDSNGSASKGDADGTTDETLKTQRVSDETASSNGSDIADSEDYVDVRERDDYFRNQDEDSSDRDRQQESRYEISHWQYHLISAGTLWPLEERRSNAEWDEIWRTLTSFMTQTSCFQAWLQAIAKDRSSALYTWNGHSNLRPLHVAAVFGLHTMVQQLISQGHDVNERVDDGYLVTPLEKICYSGATLDMTMIQLLLENKADPNGAGDNTFPAFHDVVRRDPSSEVVRLFLNHGANVKVIGESGLSCMHWFSLVGRDLEALQLLLDAGADINAVDRDGETPLHWLLRRDDLDDEMLEAYLKAGARVDIEDNESQMPLFEVSYSGNCEAAELLLAHGADMYDEDTEGLTVLHAAAKRGMVNMVKLFLEKGLPPNKPDSKGRTPLYHACQDGDHETVRLLLETLKDLPPAEINVADSQGRTPFRKAAVRGDLDILKLMISKADIPSAINTLGLKNGRNTVHGTAFNGEIAALKILIEAGADLSITDKHGLTALELCGQGWAKSSSKSNEDCLLFLIEQDPKTAAKCSDLLFKAALKGSKTVIDKLLEAGIDPMITDEHGWTPLLLAQQHNQQEIVEFLSRKKSTVRSRPTRWASSVKHIKTLEDGLQVEDIAKRQRQTTIISDHPIPAGESKFYFEIHVVHQPPKKTNCSKPVCAIGYTTLPTKWIDALPGHHAVGVRSWAWHGDDGRFFGSDHPVTMGNTWDTGDVIGCAVDFEQKSIFFTRNAERLPPTYEGVYGRLYPVIGTEGNVIIRANFGADLEQSPWKWEGHKEWLSEQ